MKRPQSAPVRREPKAPCRPQDRPSFIDRLSSLGSRLLPSKRPSSAPRVRPSPEPPLPTLLGSLNSSTAPQKRVFGPPSADELQFSLFEKGKPSRDLCVIGREREVLALPSGKPIPSAWSAHKHEIECKREQSMTLCSLASSIGWGERTTLSNGERVGQKQLYWRALLLDDKNEVALNNMGEVLSRRETVTLPDGKVMNKMQLFLKAIEIDGSLSQAYSNVGALLGRGEWVTLPDGKQMDERQLYLRAIALDRSNSQAYTNLGAMLGPGEQVTLPNGKRVDRRQLHVKALEVDEGNALAYCNLGKTLGHDETVMLPSGERLDDRQLCLKAMRMECKDKKACSLGEQYSRTLCQRMNKTNARPASAKRPSSATRKVAPSHDLVLRRPCTGEPQQKVAKQCATAARADADAGVCSYEQALAVRMVLALGGELAAETLAEVEPSIGSKRLTLLVHPDKTQHPQAKEAFQKLRSVSNDLVLSRPFTA